MPSLRRVRILLGVCALACAFGVSSSQETHSHSPPGKLGTVSFPTSCAPSVAPDFERSVALLHSFAYSASEQSFRKVAAADPACAMAHWGIAMSYYHQLWSPPDPKDLRDGQIEIERAGHLNGGSPREKQFIAAAAAYYKDSDHVAPQIRAKAYSEAMGEAARRNPQDTEAQVFYALALIATAPPEDGSHANQKRAAALLEPVYRSQPDHPGAAHYLIHAYDSAELAPRGLAAARAYSKIAPSAPHALHMPSHIYTRLGLWDDSIASNLAARAAAQIQGERSEELHAMDYLTYAYLQRGRESDAEQVVAALHSMGALAAFGSDFIVGYAATAMPVRLAMERHAWNDAVELQPMPGSAPHLAAIVFWAHAVAYARAGRAPSANGDIAKIAACKEQLQAAGNAYWAAQVDVLHKEARAWQLAAMGKAAEAARLLRLAADQEDAVEKLPVTPGPVVPAREQLGELLLEQGHSKEALREFQAALVAAPGRRGALTGGANAADLVGDSGTAAQLRSKL
jgi:tetratricopeptide (TPR) repeat protein